MISLNYNNPKQCKECKQTFFARKDRQNQLFCKISCKRIFEYKARLRSCAHCNKNFLLKNTAYEKRGGGKYCSIDCAKYATKKYSNDEQFFDKIDSEEKAYWLGFIVADGFNSNDELIIQLSEKDVSHLQKFKKTINANNPISYVKRKTNTCVLRIGSRYLCKQLTKLGCIKKKSLCVYIPNIDNNLIRHFIRGYFDGDGCCYNNGKYRVWSIHSGSTQLIQQIKNEIESSLNIKSLRLYSKNTNNNSLYTGKKEVIDNIKHYLYDDATIYLERKYNKFSHN